MCKKHTFNPGKVCYGYKRNRYNTIKRLASMLVPSYLGFALPQWFERCGGAIFYSLSFTVISFCNLSYADSTSAVKCAYLNKPLIPVTGTATITNATAEGCVDEKFTGNWEVTNIPCATVPVQYRVNVGVKTNGDVIVSYLGDTVEYVKVWLCIFTLLF